MLSRHPSRAGIAESHEERIESLNELSEGLKRFGRNLTKRELKANYQGLYWRSDATLNLTKRELKVKRIDKVL